jgi:hypothetical protein
MALRRKNFGQVAGHMVPFVCTHNGQFRKCVRVDRIALYLPLRLRPLQAPYHSSKNLAVASTAPIKKST